MDDKIRKELENLVTRFKECEKLATVFYSMLPEDDAMAASVISQTINKFAARMHMKSSDVWKMMYAVEKLVREDFLRICRMKQIILGQLIVVVIWTIHIVRTVTLQYLMTKLILQFALIAVVVWTGKSTTY